MESLFLERQLQRGRSGERAELQCFERRAWTIRSGPPQHGKHLGHLETRLLSRQQLPREVSGQWLVNLTDCHLQQRRAIQHHHRLG